LPSRYFRFEAWGHCPTSDKHRAQEKNYRSRFFSSLFTKRFSFEELMSPQDDALRAFNESNFAYKVNHSIVDAHIGEVVCAQRTPRPLHVEASSVWHSLLIGGAAPQFYCTSRGSGFKPLPRQGRVCGFLGLLVAAPANSPSPGWTVSCANMVRRISSSSASTSIRIGTGRSDSERDTRRVFNCV